MLRSSIRPSEKGPNRHSPTCGVSPQYAARPFSAHIQALRRALFFAAAAIALIVPMAVATRHAEAELALARSWPLDLSAPRATGVIFPVARVAAAAP